jgi:hypothetical protein
MTPLKKSLRNVVQKMAGTFYEGPIPPKRIVDAVEHFAHSKDALLLEEWVEFAAIHACEAYKTGYVRGVEYAERDNSNPDNPELLAAEREQTWGELDDGPPQIVNVDLEN